MKHPRSLAESVSRETHERLAAYENTLRAWNRTINLISKSDEDRIWDRHIADALQLIPLIPAGTDRAIDLGTGGGVPGLVLAIATGLPFVLVEADQRKAAFLREAARVCQAPVTVIAERIERLTLAPASLITARALAPLGVLLDLCAPLLTPDGLILALKGRTAEAELTEAQQQWHMCVERTPSVTDPAATILQISEARRVRHHS